MTNQDRRIEYRAVLLGQDLELTSRVVIEVRDRFELPMSLGDGSERRMRVADWHDDAGRHVLSFYAPASMVCDQSGHLLRFWNLNGGHSEEEALRIVAESVRGLAPA
jgi:hypothetical protein